MPLQLVLKAANLPLDLFRVPVALVSIQIVR